MPFARASSANCVFHASKPAAVLPHCAASALLTVPMTRAAKTIVLNCPLGTIVSSLYAFPSGEALARKSPGRPAGLT